MAVQDAIKTLDQELRLVLDKIHEMRARSDVLSDMRQLLVQKQTFVSRLMFRLRSLIGRSYGMLHPDVFDSRTSTRSTRSESKSS